MLDAELISLKIFETAVDTSIVRDILPAEPERYRWLLQNISNECRRYVQLHAGETYEDAKTAVSNFYAKTVLSEQDFSTNKGLSLSSLGETFEPVEPVLGAASIDPKDRECWNCGRKGHMAKDCRQPKGPSQQKGKEKGKVEKGGKGKEKKEQGKVKGGKPSGSGKNQSKGKGKGKKGLRTAEYYDLATPEESEAELELEQEALEYEGFEEDAWSEASEATEPIFLSSHQPRAA